MESLTLIKVLMNRNLLLVSLLAGCAFSANAEYETAGNGTEYTLNSLSQIEGTGVEKDGSVYTLTDNITVKAGDTFTVEAGSTIKIATGITFRVEGIADFEAPEGGRVLITRADDVAEPNGINVVSDIEGSKFKNIDFEYAALRAFGNKGFNVENCTFRYANGKLNSSGALALGNSGACFTVTDCTFEYNTVPAIGGGANILCGLVIDNCVFTDNNTANANKPQVNLTVGGDNEVKIMNSTFTGAQRTKVGAIGVNNMLAAAGENKVLIENCTVTGHRYGISHLGPMTVVIKNNTLTDNKYETNPMNGGSGISMAKLTNSIISGNHIEGSLWGITLINVASANIGEVDNPDSPGNNVFVDNGNNGVQYELYNNSTVTVYAQNNIWSVPEQTAEEIEKVIFHKTDNASLGEVIYMPAGDPASVDEVVEDAMKPYVAFGSLIAPASESGVVEVYALDGKKVAVLAIVDHSADLTDLAPGSVYVLKVVAPEGTATLKMRN